MRQRAIKRQAIENLAEYNYTNADTGEQQMFCLESRVKAGRCIFEVGVETLKEMPWRAIWEAKK